MVRDSCNIDAFRLIVDVASALGSLVDCRPAMVEGVIHSGIQCSFHGLSIRTGRLQIRQTPLSITSRSVREQDRRSAEPQANPHDMYQHMIERNASSALL